MHVASLRVLQWVQTGSCKPNYGKRTTCDIQLQRSIIIQYIFLCHAGSADEIHRRSNMNQLKEWTRRKEKSLKVISEHGTQN